MVYVMLTENKLLTKYQKYLQKDIIEFLKLWFVQTDIKYQVIYNPKFIIESKLPKINKNSIVLWEPITAANNIVLVNHYQNSIVILKNRTILLQKISEHNPINENTAINYGFLIMYIDNEHFDITNNEWKLVVSETNYTTTIEQTILRINPNANLVFPDIESPLIVPMLNQKHFDNDYS